MNILHGISALLFKSLSDKIAIIGTYLTQAKTSPKLRQANSGGVSLYSGVARSHTGWSFIREATKLTLRASISFQVTRQWIHYWNSAPYLTEIALTAPSLLKKIFRPYMTSSLRCRDRLDVLLAHYAFVFRHDLGDLVLRAATAPVTLSQFSGKLGDIYQIALITISTMEREGEMVLQLVNEGSVLFSVAFTFFNKAGLPNLAIGCLQGGRSENSQEQIRQATRNLFGLRPKTLMVRLVQQLGFQLDCSNLILVSNQNRVITQQIRKGYVFANYDETWQELEAVRRTDGDFTLPCKDLSEPDLSLIASNKRSESKKRYALLCHISQLTCENFRSLPAVPARHT